MKVGSSPQVDLAAFPPQNNLAMNRTIRQIADRYLSGPSVLWRKCSTELKRGVGRLTPVRCLTHAVGRMQMVCPTMRPTGGCSENEEGVDRIDIT